MKRISLLLLIFTLIPADVWAAVPGLSALTVTTGQNGATQYSVSLQILAIMTALSVLPALLMTMTAFTRVIIVLAMLRQAIGMATTPTNQILIGIALFLTLFIMAPVFTTVNETALQPYLNEKISADAAIAKAKLPFHQFMMKQTRQNDLQMFARLGGYKTFNTPDDIPFNILMPAYLTSELKTAFQIGVILFIPFLIIDLVVASVLMAMGMMMLSPLIISLPFKVMLFVLIDGWALTIGTLAASFGTQ